MTTRRWALIGTAALAVGLLAACDGGSATPPSATSSGATEETVGATASSSTEAPLPRPSDRTETLPLPVPTAKAPSVVGQSLEKGRERLQRMGYVVTAEDPIHRRAVSDGAEWQVIEQSQSGSTVRLGVQKYSDVPDGGSDIDDKD